MSLEIPNCYYRISVKALILDEEGRFLLCQEHDGRWELPGGGLDYGEEIHTGLQREIKEEMGLETTHIDAHPSYFLIDNDGIHRANVVYLTRVNNLDFTPSDECKKIGFFTKGTARTLRLFNNVEIFLDLFNPEKHKDRNFEM